VLNLALDTSTRRGSVALGVVGSGPLEFLGEATLEVSATHSETVLPAIDRLLAGERRSMAEVAGVVVGSGPGSFTGVRIAASLARGMCFPGRATLFAYSSLAAIAAVVPEERGVGRVCALLDARRGQVYSAGFSVDPSGGGLDLEFGPRASSLVSQLSELDASTWLFAGVLPASLRDAIAVAGGRLVAEDLHPSAAGLLRLVSIDPEGGRVENPPSWEPGYVRSSSAERRVGPA
jgi:tRNA threonylcarbamoyladenosine biosynthesis protein TsaB